MARRISLSRILLAALLALLSAGQAEPAAAGANVWTNQGPVVGRINALAIDPATPATLYAGTEDSGVFKSSDGGATWRAVNAGLTSLIVRALAIDPATPATVYAATYGGVFAIRQEEGGEAVYLPLLQRRR